MDLRPALVLALVAFAPACSALVAPDTSRLGGRDGGLGDHDAAITDAGPIDAARVDGEVPDGGRACPASCDDGVPCTTDGCDASSGTCTHTPDDTACGDGLRCAGPAGCVPMLCELDAECDDGNACNGVETCSPRNASADPATGCLDGAPLECADGVACTVDTCSPATGCVHTADDTICDDRAACTTDSCTSAGCTNTPDHAMCNGGCRTGAMCMAGVGCTGGTSVTCASDGNPCTSDPTTCDAASGTCLHPPRDDDGDGYAILRATGTGGTVTCPGGTDCNDTNPAVHPGATEVCNGMDDDCDGVIDDGCASAPDTCASEQRIELTGITGTRSGTARGSNTTLADNYRPSCGGMGGRDAVYYFDVSGLGAMDVTVTTDSPETTFDTVLAAQVGGTCGTFGRVCNDDITTGSNTRSSITMCLNASITSPPRVHVLVDGYDGSATSLGDYNVRVSATPRLTPCP